MLKTFNFLVVVALFVAAYLLVSGLTDKPASAAPAAWDNLEPITIKVDVKPAPAPVVPAPVRPTAYDPNCVNGVCRVPPAKSVRRVYQTQAAARPVLRGRLRGRLLSFRGRSFRGCS
jgi:hypothetical protein